MEAVELKRIFPPVKLEFPCFCLLTAALAAAIISAGFKGILVLDWSLVALPFETGDEFPPSGLGFELPPPRYQIDSEMYK